jgi:hypothetical protein
LGEEVIRQGPIYVVLPRTDFASWPMFNFVGLAMHRPFLVGNHKLRVIRRFILRISYN